MLAEDPNQRLTIKEIKEHPFYKGIIGSQEEIQMEFGKRFK